MHETIHRCLLFALFSFVLLTGVLGALGTISYVDSGRSVMGDLSTSTGYIWKQGSCDELFSNLSARESESRKQTTELCDLARANALPPASLKAIVDAEFREQKGDGHVSQSSAVLARCRAEFIRELPSLQAFYKPYQKRVAYMWLFIPALIGAVGGYYYARSWAPVLFAGVRGRFARLVFGKNRYDDAWQSFIRPKKKP